MNKTLIVASALAVLGAAFLGIVFVVLSNITLVSASAPSGLPATVRVATTTAVGPDYRTQLFSSSNCAARVITTVAQPIMLVFADHTNGDISSTTVSATVGHLQAASTTVAYDCGIYGSGSVYAYGYGATTTITTTETR